MKKSAGVISLLVSCAFATIGGWASESANRPILIPARPPFSERVSSYLADRGHDFMDTFQLHVGLGWIWSADVEATELAHLGLLGTVSLTYMVEQSSFAVEAPCGFPLSNLLGGLFFPGKGTEGWRRFLICHSYDRFGFSTLKVEQHRCALIPLLFTLHGTDVSSHFGPPSPKEEPPIRWADCGGGAAVMPFALRVGISPGEMLDFVAGWFGLDIAGDDNRSKQP